jgi:hypothetical protein
MTFTMPKGMINARDMVPGETYIGTADGPEALNDIYFTVFTVVTFDPTGGVPTEEGLDDSGPLLQVQYDAWGYPLPMTEVFAHYDIVRTVES